MELNPGPRSRLLFYPGHLGERTRVALRDPLRGLAFDAGQVRRVPEADALDLLRLSGFLEALPLGAAAARFGVKGKALEALRPRLTRLRREGFGELILLDGATLATLSQASPAGGRP